MTLHQRIVDTTRRTRKTLYLVAAFYVLVGVFALAAGALLGDRLSAFLGLLIICGAIEVALGVRVVLRLGVHMASVGERLEDVRDRMEQIERAGEPLDTTGLEESPTQTLDLAAIGRGNPNELTAATLDLINER